MHTLNNTSIKEFQLSRAAEFVTCWEQFYNYRIRQFGGNGHIDYLAELNLGRELTEQNLVRLLRWKDPHRLTEVIMSGPNAGQRNEKVDRARGALGALNRFRHGEVPEAQAREVISRVFQTGVVFQAFLLHIAQPNVYPIADQHVFRVFGLHRDAKAHQTWTTYSRYQDYFSAIAESMGVARVVTNVPQLKRIDNALMAFGQFLKKYYRPWTLPAVAVRNEVRAAGTLRD